MNRKFTFSGLAMSIIMLGLWGCDRGNMSSPERMTFTGFKPIYASSADLDELVRSVPAKPLSGSGKIYVKGNLLLINKPYEGIHVVDNSNPASPVNLSFIEIPGNIDISMKGNYLYADYAGQVAVIDLSNVNNPRLVQKITLSVENQQYPPVSAGTGWGRTYFECPDSKKGIIIGWVQTQLSDPKCWR